MKPSSTFAPSQCRQQLTALLPGAGEVVLGEGQHRRHGGSVDLAVLLEVVQAHRHRPVGVAADPDAVHVLAEVQVGVLVAQDRHPDLTRLVVAPDQLGDLPGLHVLVGQRQQRDVHADHRADRRAPEAGARHDDVGLDDPLGGAHAGDAATRLLDADHAGGALEARPACFGAPREGDHRARGLRQAVGRRVQAAEDTVAVQQGVEPDALLRVDERALDPPRRQPPVPAAQVGQPLRGRRDLQPADLLEAPRAVEVESGELVDGVGRELRHRLRRAHLEHEPGCVGGRAAGQRERALVDDRHPVDATCGQLVGEVGSDDAGPDDHDAGCGGHACSWSICSGGGSGRTGPVRAGQPAVRYSVAASSSQLVRYPANDERTMIW